LSEVLRGHMTMKWASFAQFGEDFGSFRYWKNRATMDLYHDTSERASRSEVRLFFFSCIVAHWESTVAHWLV